MIAALLLFAAAGFLIFAAGFVLGTAYGVDQETQRNEEVQRWMRKLRRDGVIGSGDYD